jgi:hypothetical protein
MKINKHKVLFGKSKSYCKTAPRWEDYVHYHIIKQRWDIPSLDLYGYVIVKDGCDDRSLDEIEQDIQNEVNYDLEQRIKREAGILTSKSPNCSCC